MSDRIQKRRGNSTRDRHRLFEAIERDGIEVMPCSRCWNATPRRRCVMSASSKRCASCVREGKKCDGPSVADVCESRLRVLLAALLTGASDSQLEGTGSNREGDPVR